MLKKNPKIDVSLNKVYQFSTMAYRTCRDAKAWFSSQTSKETVCRIDHSVEKQYFSKGSLTLENQNPWMNGF